jgi:hypothetical protein
MRQKHDVAGIGARLLESKRTTKSTTPRTHVRTPIIVAHHAQPAQNGCVGVLVFFFFFIGLLGLL